MASRDLSFKIPINAIGSKSLQGFRGYFHHMVSHYVSWEIEKELKCDILDDTLKTLYTHSSS